MHENEGVHSPQMRNVNYFVKLALALWAVDGADCRYPRGALAGVGMGPPNRGGGGRQKSWVRGAVKIWAHDARDQIGTFP